jgi:hypothetical protein
MYGDTLTKLAQKSNQQAFTYRIASSLNSESTTDTKLIDDLGNTVLDWSRIMHRKNMQQQLNQLA